MPYMALLKPNYHLYPPQRKCLETRENKKEWVLPLKTPQTREIHGHLLAYFQPHTWVRTWHSLGPSRAQLWEKKAILFVKFGDFVVVYAVHMLR